MHTAVLTLHSLIMSSRFPSKFSMNHLLPCCIIFGGLFATGAGAADLKDTPHVTHKTHISASKLLCCCVKSRAVESKPWSM